MRKEQKQEIVKALVDQIKSSGNFYITDTADLTVEKVNDIRRECFKKGISMRVAKNTLIRKALEESGVGSDELYGVLKGASTIMFSEVAKAPAKMIEALRKKGDKPIIKAAYVEETTFIGDDQLKTLATLMSRDELIGDVIGLLQSPAKNLISALQSGGSTISGLVKALEERG